MGRKLLFFCLSIFGLVTTSFSQEARNNTANTNTWFMYFGNHKFNDRWGWHAEAQWRRHDVVSENQQLLFRTGVDYYTASNNRVTIGYAFVNTYPYGEFAVVNTFPEHRTWQQFLTTQSLGVSKLAHRYRLEQRWIGNPATSSMDNGRYENRFRYMAKFTTPLTQEWRTNLFLAIYDEVMLNFGKEVAYNIFDQNRIYAALGVSFSPTMKLEVGYLYQLVQLRTLDANLRNRIENNHTLQIGLFSTLAFRKRNVE